MDWELENGSESIVQTTRSKATQEFGPPLMYGVVSGWVHLLSNESSGT